MTGLVEPPKKKNSKAPPQQGWVVVFTALYHTHAWPYEVPSCPFGCGWSRRTPTRTCTKPSIPIVSSGHSPSLLIVYVCMHAISRSFVLQTRPVACAYSNL